MKDKRIYNIPRRIWRKRPMLRKRVRHARQHPKEPSSPTASSNNATFLDDVFNPIIGLLLLCILYLMANAELYNDIQYQPENIVVAKSYDDYKLDCNPDTTELHSFSNYFTWYAWCLNNWSVDWYSALLFALRATLSLSVHYAMRSKSGITLKNILRKNRSNSSALIITKVVETEISIASQGSILFILYHALGYIPSIMNQFQVELAYCLITCATILLVEWLDGLLAYCASKVINSLRVRRLGAAELQTRSSILHCVLSLILTQNLVILGSTLLKSFVIGGQLSPILSLLWHDAQWNDFIESISLLGRPFAVILAKNIIAARLRSNCSSSHCVIYQLKTMFSTTKTIVKSYIVTIAFGLLLRTAVCNMTHSITGQVFGCINKGVEEYCIILIPLNILSGVMGYFTLHEFCSLLLKGMLLGLNWLLVLIGQESSSLANVTKNSESHQNDTDRARARAQDLELTPKHLEKGSVPPSSLVPKCQHTMEVTVGNSADGAVMVDSGAVMKEDGIKVENVDLDEDDELRNFQNDWRRHQQPQEHEEFMVPVPHEEVEFGGEPDASPGVQSCRNETTSAEKINTSRTRRRTRSSMFGHNHSYTICILSTLCTLALASEDTLPDPSLVTNIATIVAAGGVAGFAGARIIGGRVDDEISEEGSAIITYLTAPEGPLGLTPKFHANQPGAVITGINNDKCKIKDSLAKGDLIVSIDGEVVTSMEDLKHGSDNERNLGIIRANQALILDGVVFFPPADDKTYTDDQVRLLGKKFSSKSLVDSINQAGYYPKRTKVYDLTRDLMGSALSQDEQHEYEDMMYHWKEVVEGTNESIDKVSKMRAVITTYLTAPEGPLGLTPKFHANQPGAVITGINNDKCKIKDSLAKGDLIVSIDGEVVTSMEDLKHGSDNERNLGIIRANQALILDGVVFFPPADDKTYTDDQVRLLGKKFSSKSLVDSINQAGYYPKRTKVYDLTRDLMGSALSQDEQHEYEDMMYHVDKGLNEADTSSTKYVSSSQPSTELTPEINQCSQSQCTVVSPNSAGHSAKRSADLSDNASNHQNVASHIRVHHTSNLSDNSRSSSAALISPTANSICEEESSDNIRSSTAALISPTANSICDEESSIFCFEENTNLISDLHDDDDDGDDGDNQVCLDTKAAELLDLITSADSSFHPGTNLQSIAYMVLQKIQGSAEHTPIELSFRGGRGRIFKTRYMKLPNKVACKASSNARSKSIYVREKAKTIKAFLDEVIEQSTDNGMELATSVIKKIAEEYDLFVLAKAKIQLLPVEVALLRDIIGTTTNGIYRLKSALESIRPELRGILLPPCIKAVLARVDGNDNFECRTVDREVYVTKEGTIKGLRPFAYIVRPWEVIERIVDKTKVEGTYKPSETWMKAQNKCVITLNADKGNDLNLSIRCANKEGGNSMNDTYCVSSVEGPVCECIETEMETIFNDEYPIRMFLQNLLDQSYYVLSIMTPDGNQCQSIVFQPTPKSDKVCVSRPIGVTLLHDLSTKESDPDVEFSKSVSDNNGPPEVSIPTTAESVAAKLVFDGDNKSIAVGVQLIVGTETAYTHRFHTPLNLGDMNIGEMKASVEQIIGFPPNDGKQQLICIGIPSNSCRYACPTCTCHRNDFGNWSERLWQAGVRLGLKTGPWPHENVIPREGYWSLQKCLDRYNYDTDDGQFPPSKGSKAEERLSLRSASVSKTIGLNVWPEINCGDVLHLSAGMINHTMNKIRKHLRAFEKDSQFMSGMISVKEEVEKVLQELEIKRRKNAASDDQLESILAPLHKESMAIRNEMSKSLEKAHQLETELHYGDDSELDENARQTVESLRDTNKEIQEQIEMHLSRADELLEECKNHSEDTGYGHFILLQKGLMTFYSGIVNFLSGSSKKPHGKLEFVFNNALEHIGGGKFSAENGGFDQTNGRGMNTLEKFDQVADVCILAYRSDPKHEEVEQMFEDYKELASHLYQLTKYMKSQKRRDANVLVELLVKFLAKYEKLFPNESCYNKLHFVMWHLVAFVEKWETCGRLSAESHESVHSAFEKAKFAVSKMSSTSKRFSTLFARMTLDLKDNVARLKKEIKERTTGKTRGKYKSNYANKRKDNIDFVAATYDDTVTVDGQEFTVLPCGGGRIYKEYLHRYVYVATGRAPDDWVQCFADSKLLSQSKQEEAKYATYHRVS